jgi:L-threonylcarbamoyladenylate synthase
MKELNIKQAVEALCEGLLVVVPTETVYGLAADAGNESALKLLYEVKGRPVDKPCMLQIADLKDLEKFVVEVPTVAQKIINKYWPGPVSIVLKAKPGISMVITAGKDTIGIRMPAQDQTLELLRQFGGALAVPSANLSGQPSPRSVTDVEAQLDGDSRIAGAIDAGPCRYGKESTIVEFQGEDWKVLREGVISTAEIEETLNSK